MQTNDRIRFFEVLRTNIAQNWFVKITLSKAVGSDKSLKNIYGRLVEIKGQKMLSFTYRFRTKDEVKNFTIEEGIEQIDAWIGSAFLNADLLTTESDWSLQLNKKRKARLFEKPATHSEQADTAHDKSKKKWIDPKTAMYLVKMGVTNQQGEILKSGQKKFRQINKYVEIMDGIFRNHPLPSSPKIVDMGSGKGYLTFALFDYLQNQGQFPDITGIELRQNLVDFCNQLAKDNQFENLSFLAQNIEEYPSKNIDVLIALHACDIATDIAIAKGIKADAEIIVVAPCCHKQLRKDMKCTSELQAVLQYGILEERQAELLTDGIRALLLEANGYKTKVFEFISTEHTPKNVMIVATKAKPKKDALQKVAAIKKQFGIKRHYLEELLK